MIKTIKVMLYPNQKQKTKLFECAGTARFIYNWVLDYEQINYDCDNGFINDHALRKKADRIETNTSQVYMAE